MDYYKLLNDYLNFNGAYTDYNILNFEDKGSFIEVYYCYDERQHRATKNITLFELITFIYSPKN